MILYISGAISSCPGTYRQKFAEAEKKLTDMGFTVINPAVLPEGLAAESYMQICFAMIDAADGVCMIEAEWWKSKGAQLENAYAEYQHKKVCFLEDMV